MTSIALIGFGGAGLAFVHQLLNSSLKKWRLFVIDPDLTSAYSKTWCYWGQPEELSSIQHNMLWNTLNVKHNDDLLVRPLHKLNYRCVQGRDFHTQVYEQVQQHPNIQFIHQAAHDVQYDEATGRVRIQLSASESITADYCFTSASQGKADGWRPDFYQQFAGGWVRFNKPVFSQHEIMLMDFDIPQEQKSVHFAYRLPNNTHEALIEITAFTPTLLSEDHFNTMYLNYLNMLADTYDADYELTGTEKGIIPMDTRPYTRQVNPATFTLGTVSGMVKPSTGYAFYKMHEQARYYIHQMISGGKLTAYPETHPRFKFYDDLLLDILKTDPHATIPIFHQLFQRVDADAVLDFLREQSRLSSEAKIFLNLPKIPFLKALWRYVFK